MNKRVFKAWWSHPIRYRLGVGTGTWPWLVVCVTGGKPVVIFYSKKKVEATRLVQLFNDLLTE